MKRILVSTVEDMDYLGSVEWHWLSFFFFPSESISSDGDRLYSVKYMDGLIVAYVKRLADPCTQHCNPTYWQIEHRLDAKNAMVFSFLIVLYGAWAIFIIKPEDSLDGQFIVYEVSAWLSDGCKHLELCHRDCSAVIFLTRVNDYLGFMISTVA